jgi:hypothetical protein
MISAAMRAAGVILLFACAATAEPQDGDLRSLSPASAADWSYRASRQSTA